MGKTNARTRFRRVWGWRYDILGVGGAMLIVEGVSRFSGPAAWITAGSFAVVGAYLGASTLVKS